jgi:hypothetical protein
VRATGALFPASIGAVLFFALVLWQALGFPEVEDPWPDRIGIEFVFTAAGAGGVLLGVLHAKSPPPVRDQAINRGGRVGFYIGLGFYLLSLLVQLVSLG